MPMTGIFPTYGLEFQTDTRLPENMDINGGTLAYTDRLGNARLMALTLANYYHRAVCIWNDDTNKKIQIVRPNVPKLMPANF